MLGAGELDSSADDDVSASFKAASTKLEVVLGHNMPRSETQRAALFPRCSGLSKLRLRRTSVDLCMPRRRVIQSIHSHAQRIETSSERTTNMPV